jgi:small subunit ribosomal protein S1
MSTDRPEETFAALFETMGKGVPARRTPRPGERLRAVVIQIGRDSVFVELEGRRQGILEVSELRAPDATLKVAVGDRLAVRVVRVDADGGVHLAPTVEAAASTGAAIRIDETEPTGVRVAIGEVVGCTVDRVESYGLFVQIDGTRTRAGRGLLPLVELGVPRGTDLRKAFPAGSKLKAKILALGEGKLRLSLRAVKDDEERSQFDAFRQAENKGTPPGLGTFGDLFRKRK